MNELVKLIEKWAREKNLDIAEPEKQMLKVVEEVGEVAAALARNNKNDLRDGWINVNKVDTKRADT